MKFLIMQTVPGLPVPPDQMKAIVEALEVSVQIFKDLERQGKVESVYGFPEGGGCGIVNADSAEELNKILNSIPIMNFGKTEVRPLADLEAVAKNLREVVR